MIKVYIYFNKNNFCQTKIILKKNTKIIITCNSAESLKKELVKLQSLKFSSKVIICRKCFLMEEKEILSFFNIETPPIDYKCLASLLLPKLNFSNNKPKDLVSFIKNICPLEISDNQAKIIIENFL